MSDIRLQAGVITANIATNGAWLTDLTDESGPILMPKGMLLAADGVTQKERGGCHVCIPNFDSGGDSGLPHHGFGRVLDWEVVDQTETNLVLSLKSGTGDYEALSSQLTYELTETSLAMKLELLNGGETVLPISPAFHPYFMTAPGAGEVTINGGAYQLDQLVHAAVLDEPAKEVFTGSHTYRLASEGLPAWVLWSDRLSDYVCLEPTAAGMDFAGGNARRLQPAETAIYTCEIAWAV